MLNGARCELPFNCFWVVPIHQLDDIPDYGLLLQDAHEKPS